MKEIFVPIKDYEGLYEISNLGRVKSCAKEWISGRNHVIIKKEESIMAGGVVNGYKIVTLSKDRIKKTFRISLLVWDYFGVGKRCGHKVVVDHIDENKLNNHITNLQILLSRHNSIKSAKYKKDILNNGTSKFVGVRRRKNKWVSQITINKRCITLGTFENEDDASAEYNRALEEYSESGNVTRIKIKKQSSEYVGVYWHKTYKKWKAILKGRSLGLFYNEYDAHLAYQKSVADCI